MRRTGRRGLCWKPAGEKLESPLGCSCQDSREADIIHLISSYRLQAKQQYPRGVFLLNWAKGTHSFPLRTVQVNFSCHQTAHK